MKLDFFYKNFLILLVSFFIVSCQEDIEIKLPSNGNQRIVVEGRITNEFKEHPIRISQSGNYFSTDTIEPALINNVQLVENGTGKIYSVNKSDTSANWYFTDALKGKVGETYSLKFTYKSQDFEAKSLLDTVATMDSISYEYQYIAYYKVGFYMLKMSAFEPEPAGNIYMFNVYINDTLYNDQLRLTSFQDDAFFNGQYVENIDITYLPQEEIKCDTNKIKIEMLSISKEEFDFNNAFLSETQGNGSIFSGPPADVPSNVINLSGGDNGLGHFGASSVASIEMFLYKMHNDSTNNPDYKK
jgi:hypothetical protein